MLEIHLVLGRSVQSGELQWLPYLPSCKWMQHDLPGVASAESLERRCLSRQINLHLYSSKTTRTPSQWINEQMKVRWTLNGKQGVVQWTRIQASCDPSTIPRFKTPRRVRSVSGIY